ncbi:hypothetical protein [Halarcobacter ebronensis]|uniref:Uncharacterized protein n=1 Tax=Halarcobacter ebronensis TaxID=1462615 RepID=A0A4Q1APB0_9BACT|nr:hypothetical protein [Halarcobacter ebronensis]QKF81714.1 putative membrane protein [Halarcobacter ebronensis]RXK04608.1 hypothetical protein CRV07_10660 [Halarcobacter ebronensis]
MHLRFLLILFLSNISLFAHGIFYDVTEGAVNIRISTANNLSISNANVEVFAPGGNLAYARGFTDVNGNFAFMPDSGGKWHVKVIVPSDHGNHDKEFNVELSDDYKVKDFDRVPVERYLGFFSVLGIMLGVFGIFSFYREYKRRKLEKKL